MGILIRHLTESDLPFANSVREIAGWNQTLTDWRRFLSLEPEGCFLAEWDGQPAGTATTTCYGDSDLAWIGMVLVHPDFRRRGIGTALLKHCISYLTDTRSIQSVKLDATPEGRPLYRKLGFRDEWPLCRWMGKDLRQSRKPVSRRKQKLAEHHYELDRMVFGSNRRRLLESLAEESTVVVANENGFGMAREGSRATYLGPISVTDPWTDPEPGQEILRELLATVEPGPEGMIFIDQPLTNFHANQVLSEFGFEIVRKLVRMYLGECRVNEPWQMFGIAEPGLG